MLNLTIVKRSTSVSIAECEPTVSVDLRDVSGNYLNHGWLIGSACELGRPWVSSANLDFQRRVTSTIIEHVTCLWSAFGT